MPRPFRLTPPRPPRLSENDVERACIDLLRYRGYYVMRQQSGLFKTPDGRWVRIGTPGIPDYAALHARWPGFLMEVKRPGGELSPEQHSKVTEIAMGYRVAIAVVESVDALAQWLAAHERSP